VPRVRAIETTFFGDAEIEDQTDNALGRLNERFDPEIGPYLTVLEESSAADLREAVRMENRRRARNRRK
jgi:hypothetical protein